MPTSIPSLTEARFTDLVTRARAAGASIELHDAPGCTFLVVPGRRKVLIGARTPLPERYRMLCEALRRLHLGGVVNSDPVSSTLSSSLESALPVTAQPATRHAPGDDSLELSITVSLSGLEATAVAREVRPTRQVYLEPLAGMQRSELGQALVEDCEDTLRDDTHRLSRKSLEQHLASMATTADSQLRLPDCELCTERHYGTINEIALCRSHIYALVQGRLLPDEVLALRQKHPNHSELSSVLYDVHGEVARHGR